MEEVQKSLSQPITLDNRSFAQAVLPALIKTPETLRYSNTTAMPNVTWTQTDGNTTSYNVSTLLNES